MQTIELRDLEGHLAEMLEAAAAGDEFLVAQNGEPLVTVSSARLPLRRPMIFGSLAGTAVIPDDFDRYMEDEIAEMFGVND